MNYPGTQTRKEKHQETCQTRKNHPPGWTWFIRGHTNKGLLKISLWI
jgi:hypothetical protein